MHREPLIDLLRSYQPTDSQEREDKVRMLHFITHNPDCFERSLVSGHMTASAWVVNKANTHALLMLHAKLKRWLQLGGHCDGQNDILGVALKEAQEESGITGIYPVTPAIFDIDIHLIPAQGREAAHYHYDVRFLLQVQSDEEITRNSESITLQWFSREGALLPTTNASIRRMFNKWKNCW